MLNRLRTRTQSEAGFTLVELLVVMLILALLATIAIPAFFNQRLKAQDAEAKSIAKTTATALETYATTNNGSYVAADRAKLKAIEPTLSSAVNRPEHDHDADRRRQLLHDHHHLGFRQYLLDRASGGRIDHVSVRHRRTRRLSQRQQLGIDPKVGLA